MTQKEQALKLIQLTLFKDLKWYPQGSITNRTIKIEAATTQVDKHTVSILFDKRRGVFIDGKKLRLPKELTSDLLSIIKLKIAKTLKKNVSFNRVKKSISIQ